MIKPKKKEQLNKYIQLTGVAFQMGITIYLGAYFGKWLDEKYVVENSIFTIIFSLLGVFAALYYVIKQVQKIK
ncbi:AtpZ/AtpI family protein [Lutibacter sp.]